MVSSCGLESINQKVSIHQKVLHASVGSLSREGRRGEQGGCIHLPMEGCGSRIEG